MKRHSALAIFCLSIAIAMAPRAAMAHGDVTPQAVDTHALPPLGADLRGENPYRGLADAAKIGYSAYTQNCARCHGLEAISGGMSPDLRTMDSDCVGLKDAAKKKACLKEVDTYFLESTFKGKARNGAVYMPPFEGVFNQEAVWAIRTYVEVQRDAMK